MKTVRLLSLFATINSMFLISACASKSSAPVVAPAPVTQVTNMPAPAPVYYNATTQPRTGVTYDYTQRLYAPAPGATALAPQQHAGEIIDAFKPVYAKLNNPRLVIYVNRDIFGKAQPSAKTTPAPSGQGVVVATNAIADKQTARDIERLIGRPFRYAGATLSDPQMAATLASGDMKSDAARQGLLKVADIAIEALVSSRTITLPQVSGESATIAIPDIQLTAMRLSDSAIIGQATAAEIINHLPPAALANLNVQDVLEATALNLMADMTATAK